MPKISDAPSNQFFPQTLFLLGTFREDHTPNFGLFSWITYCHEEQMEVIISIGEPKLTRDLIRRNGMLSMNLVSRDMLSMADYFGGTESYTNPDKMKVPFEWFTGAVLDVPVLDQSPVSLELEVKQAMDWGTGTIFICLIRNRLADSRLLDESLSIQERQRLADPALSGGKLMYYGLGGYIADWYSLKDGFVQR